MHQTKITFDWLGKSTFLRARFSLTLPICSHPSLELEAQRNSKHNTQLFARPPAFVRNVCKIESKSLISKTWRVWRGSQSQCRFFAPFFCVYLPPPNNDTEFELFFRLFFSFFDNDEVWWWWWWWCCCGVVRIVCRRGLGLWLGWVQLLLRVVSSSLCIHERFELYRHRRLLIKAKWFLLLPPKTEARCLSLIFMEVCERYRRNNTFFWRRHAKTGRVISARVD